jgi:cation diffusion facilitator family transporter
VSRWSDLNPQQRTALASVLAAAALVTIKLVAGLLSGSLGLLAEALHSGTDLIAAVLTFAALRVAVRPPDREHPYGHGKAEHLAALGEAAVLVLVSALIAFQSIDRLASGRHAELDPSLAIVAVIAVVLVLDASRATVSWRVSRRYHSAALASNAVHFGSDLLGSTAVLAGILLARAGFPEADAIAALLVACLVVAAAVRLMRQNVQVLMDRSPAEAELKVRGAIAKAEPRTEVRRVRVREAGGRSFADVTIGVPADAALGQGHAVADGVEQAVREALPGSDVVVHVEPNATHGGLRERATGAALTVRDVREVHNVRIAHVHDRRELSLHLKLPGDLTLERAHDVACAVEDAIRAAVPELDTVHTHLEPLAGDEVEQQAVAAAGLEPAIHDIVERHPGTALRALRLRRSDDGIVAYLTITLDPDAPLERAHGAARELEREVEALPDVADAVVHTEPR